MNPAMEREKKSPKIYIVTLIIIFQRLKHITPRQTDLNLEEVASRFHEHQIRLEQTAFRERFLESEARLQQQQQQRQVLLERSRLLHAKQSEMVAKIK